MPCAFRGGGLHGMPHALLPIGIRARLHCGKGSGTGSGECGRLAMAALGRVLAKDRGAWSISPPSGMPTFQHATTRFFFTLPGVEAPACAVQRGGMALASEGGLAASEGAWLRARGPGRNHENGMFYIGISARFSACRPCAPWPLCIVPLLTGDVRRESSLYPNPFSADEQARTSTKSASWRPHRLAREAAESFVTSALRWLVVVLQLRALRPVELHALRPLELRALRP